MGRILQLAHQGKGLWINGNVCGQDCDQIQSSKCIWTDPWTKYRAPPPCSLLLSNSDCSSSPHRAWVCGLLLSASQTLSIDQESIDLQTKLPWLHCMIFSFSLCVCLCLLVSVLLFSYLCLYDPLFEGEKTVCFGVFRVALSKDRGFHQKGIGKDGWEKRKELAMKLGTLVPCLFSSF